MVALTRIVKNIKVFYCVSLSHYLELESKLRKYIVISYKNNLETINLNLKKDI